MDVVFTAAVGTLAGATVTAFVLRIGRTFKRVTKSRTPDEQRQDVAALWQEFLKLSALWREFRTLLSTLTGTPPPSFQELSEQLAALRKNTESRVGVKLRMIGLVLPAGERERYVEQWMDERNAIRRGEFPKQRFHGLRLLCGAVVQSYETRVHARRSVE